MRINLSALSAAIFYFITNAAMADPYCWCAKTSNVSSSTSCYYHTLAQCRAAVSGYNHAFCQPNYGWDGCTVATPGSPAKCNTRKRCDWDTRR